MEKKPRYSNCDRHRKIQFAEMVGKRSNPTKISVLEGNKIQPNQDVYMHELITKVRKANQNKIKHLNQAQFIFKL